MNLRVDLILDTEKRSPSVVNTKLVVRVSSITVPAIIALLVITSVLGNMRLGSKLRQLEIDSQGFKTKSKQSLLVSQQLAANDHVLKALDGWMQSRLKLQDHVEGLIKVVPSDIQLNSFSFSQRILTIPGENNITVRNSSFAIDGKAIGDQSESNLNLLTKRFKTEKPFSDVVQTVSMKVTHDSSPGANRSDRVFNISFQYLPRKFLP